MLGDLINCRPFVNQGKHSEVTVQIRETERLGRLTQKWKQCLHLH
jgi:hypothetical protein